MTNGQAIAITIILIVIAVMCLTIWGIASKTDENLRLYIDELNAKLGRYEQRITSVERKTRRKADSSTMTEEKMTAVNEWLKEVDIKTLAVVDQQEISNAAVDHIARLEAIYDKYHQNDVRYR